MDSPQDLTSVRAELERMLAELDSASSTLAAEAADAAGPGSELSHLGQHPADQASDLADNDREVAMLEAGEARRAELQAALRRVADGSYGTCADCRRPVPPERLEARPEAERCLDCQRKVDAAA